MVGYGCSSYPSGDIFCASGVKGKKTGLDDCSVYPEDDLKYWCYTERSRTIEDVNDCDKIPEDPSLLFDDCIRWYAFKQRDRLLCSSIRNEGLKEVCELKIRYAR
jgi:hypothetical protein